jgi:hypothetical protein
VSEAEAEGVPVLEVQDQEREQLEDLIAELLIAALAREAMQ